MKKISVIVPIYNLRKYLPAFLDQILSSTYENIEVVAVDNNSKDGSLKYLKERAKKDNRLKVFRESKQGPSHARQKGFIESSGDYICFMDGDDLPSHDAFENYIKAFDKTGADAILANYTELYANTKKEKKAIFKGLDPSTNLRENPKLFFVKPTLCNKCFKRSLIKKTDFIDSWLAEDMLVSLSALKRAKKAYYIDESVYTYKLHDYGLSHSVDPDKMISIISSIDALRKELSPELSEEADFIAYTHILYRIFRTVLVIDDKKRVELYDKFREYISTIDIKNNKYYKKSYVYRMASFVLLKQKVYNNAVSRYFLKIIQTNPRIFKMVKKLDI